MSFVYISLKDAIETYYKTIQVSGGGAQGIISTNLLESTLDHIQNDDYYPTFIDKLTHLFFSACKSHCFQDGNKRIAISLGAQFLLFNGYVFIAGKFIKKMENISYHVASSKISKDLLKEIIYDIIYQEESEAVQLKIFEAISKED